MQEINKWTDRMDYRGGYEAYRGISELSSSGGIQICKESLTGGESESGSVRITHKPKYSDYD